MIMRNITEIIQAMCKSEKLGAYGKTLLGPRTRGSITTAGLEALPEDTIGTDVTDRWPNEVKIPGCRYIQFFAPELHGCLGALALGVIERLGSEYVKMVCLERGQHGWELVISRHKLLHAHTECHTYEPWITVILGPDETGTFPEIVWTWHPGAPLAPVSKGISEYTAVKLV